jgi:hypothetical protein
MCTSPNLEIGSYPVTFRFKLALPDGRITEIASLQNFAHSLSFSQPSNKHIANNSGDVKKVVGFRIWEETRRENVLISLSTNTVNSHFVFLNREQEIIFTPTQIIGKTVCCKSRGCMNDESRVTKIYYNIKNILNITKSIF